MQPRTPRVVIFAYVLFALAALVCVVPSAQANDGTWSWPFSGTCSDANGTNCFYVSNTRTSNGTYAIWGESSTGRGVMGRSSASSNNAPGVEGSTQSMSQGVGVKGVAWAGSTAVWARNEDGGDNVGVWSDGRVYVSGSDFVAYTSGKGIILRNGTLCQRITLHSGGGSLDYATVTCP